MHFLNVSQVLLVSSNNDCIVLTLGDVFPDIQSRIDLYLYQITCTERKFTVTERNSIATLLINRIVFRERGIFLSKKLFEEILLKSLNWLVAEIILLDLEATTALRTDSVLLFYTSLSFKEVCLHSLKKVHEECLVDKNHFLRLSLLYSLNSLVSCGQEKYNYYLKRIFEVAEKHLDCISQVYSDSRTTTPLLIQLYSFPTVSLSGTLVFIAMKHVLLNEHITETKRTVELLRMTHIDCARFFCNFPYSESNINSLLDVCEGLINCRSEARSIRVMDDRNTRSVAKYMSPSRRDEPVDFFKKDIIIIRKTSGEKIQPIPRILLSECDYSIVEDPEVLNKFISLLKLKIDDTNDTMQPPDREEPIVFDELDDEKIKELYLNVDETREKKERVMRSIFPSIKRYKRE